MEKRGLCVGFLPTYSLSFSLVSDYDCVMHNEIAFMKLETRVTVLSVANSEIAKLFLKIAENCKIAKV